MILQFALYANNKTIITIAFIIKIKSYLVFPKYQNTISVQSIRRPQQEIYEESFGSETNSQVVAELIHYLHKIWLCSRIEDNPANNYSLFPGQRNY